LKKKIGIVGGISSASTIQYYRTISDLYFKQFNDYYYPEIIIDSLNFQYFTDLENENKTQEYMDYIVKSANNLEKAGAVFIIMAANSPHSVFEEVEKRTNLPMISIVDTAAKYALKENLKKVLLTGIKYTMQSDFYQKGFNKLGIEVIVPCEEHQNKINDIIFNELVINKFLNETKKEFLGIVDSYDVDGVILGCTELPLLVKQTDTYIKILDTLSLHCDAALQFSINNE